MHMVLQQIQSLVETRSSLDDSIEEVQETANSLTTNNLQLEILKLLHHIKEDLKVEKETN